MYIYNTTYVCMYVCTKACILEKYKSIKHVDVLYKIMYFRKGI